MNEILDNRRKNVYSTLSQFQKLKGDESDDLMPHVDTHIKTHGTSICISVTRQSGNKVLPPFKDCMATMTRRANKFLLPSKNCMATITRRSNNYII